MKPKVITFYLPQFHKVPENDKWWGEGFTDWVSAKNAIPLFPGHYQPRLPAHDDYYDILEKETIQWQAKIAKKSGVYGFCIYHYWFGNDRQLLEKPAENLLKWEDIDIHYCFSWANEPWVCSWSKFKGNAWIQTEREAQDKAHHGILVEQEYGDETEWKKHFEYLLPFFHDNRYIKKDNKPVFVIYRPEDMKQIKQMIQYWNLLAVEQGFSGIYFIGTNDIHWKQKEMNAGVFYEPCFSLEQKNRYTVTAKKTKRTLKKFDIDIPRLYGYDKIWRLILDRRYKAEMYYGGFVDYDDTPRHGCKGTVIKGMSPYKFGKYFGKLYKKSSDRGDDFIFLSAWNEWGEGAYLEPDQKYGMRCLWELRQIIKRV